jgi:hypothetical protein
MLLRNCDADFKPTRNLDLRADDLRHEILEAVPIELFCYHIRPKIAA